MRIVTTIEDIHSDAPTAVAIGKFDGVHLGHRKLLAQILAARADGLCATVFTFVPSPEELFAGETGALTTREEKRQILAGLGVDLLVEYPLDQVSAAVEPDDFIREYLCRRLRTRLVAAGGDLSYGAGARGGYALLEAMRRQCGYETRRVEKLVVEGEALSSRRIRALVAQGRMAAAARCLGGPYTVGGVVVHGQRIGRTLGFPTVNILPPPGKLLPPHGVYRSHVALCPGESPQDAPDRTDAPTWACGGDAGCRQSAAALADAGCAGLKPEAPGCAEDAAVQRAAWAGVTNIGVRPTVDRGGALSVETYLYGCERELYGETLRVALLDYVRPEQRFTDVEALRTQLAEDVERCRPVG